MRDLVDIHYPEAKRIRVVLDNLSTHSPGALYETFPAADAHRILDRIEFHHTPKHASWLNMVEIEIGVLRNRASTAASQTAPPWSARSLHGKSSAATRRPVLPGCSPPSAPEPNWPGPTP